MSQSFLIACRKACSWRLFRDAVRRSLEPSFTAEEIAWFRRPVRS